MTERRLMKVLLNVYIISGGWPLIVRPVFRQTCRSAVLCATGNWGLEVNTKQYISYETYTMRNFCTEFFCSSYFKRYSKQNMEWLQKRGHTNLQFIISYSLGFLLKFVNFRYRELIATFSILIGVEKSAFQRETGPSRVVELV